MAANTNIEWCDASWNPWIGCTKVSPGCDHCYAERDFDLRKHRVKWGPGNPRSRTSAANWHEPEKWNALAFFECQQCGWRGDEKQIIGVRCPCCVHEALKPARRRVFCASLGDVFDNEVPQEWRIDLFRLIAETPNLDWLLLTKRIGNADRMLRDVHIALGDENEAKLPRWPWPNVWLGATIVNQEEADRDIPKLLATPARVRFLSMEPLLGPVNLTEIDAGGVDERTIPREFWTSMDSDESHPALVIDVLSGSRRQRWGEWEEPGPSVDWVIVGGESGPHARPMHPDWARSLRDQCEAAGVPCMFKQHGEWIAESQQDRSPQYPDIVADGAHGCPVTGWPESKVHRWSDGSQSYRCGKKAAGRLLDGAEHNSFPEAR